MFTRTLKRLLLAISMCCLVAGCATKLGEGFSSNSEWQSVDNRQFIRPKLGQKLLFLSSNYSTYDLPLTDKEQRSQTCGKYNTLNVNYKRTKIDTEHEAQSEKIKFYSQIPLKTRMGIKSAKIDENMLVINLTNKDEFEEYEAPVSYVIDKTYWEGQSGLTVIENLAFWGLPLLFNPVGEFHKVFGCTDERVIRKELDLTKGMKTGKSLWVDGAAKNTIQVKGFDRDYIFEEPQSTADYNYGEVRINLGDALVDSALNEVTKLTVICQTCELSDTNSQSEFKMLKTNVELSSDFRAARVSEIRKLKREEDMMLANQQVQQPKNISPSRSKAQRRIPSPKLVFNSSPQKTDGSVELSGRVISDASISEISINGRLLEVSLVKDGSFKVARRLPMGATTYRLSVVDEFDQKAEAEINIERAVTQSVELVTVLDPHKIKAKVNPNAVALIIGVESYSNLPQAQYADSDANHFYDYANQSLGVPPNKIKLLTDLKASRIEILKAMRSWMKTEVISGRSDVYIFFAGHGLASADGDKTYLLPTDGDRDLLDETSILRDDLIASAKGAKTITMFLDTCYSGGTRTNEVLLADARPIAILPDKSALPSNVTVLAAASGAQLSSTYEAAQQGLFSYWLMKGLEGDADANKDKKITTGELHEYVARHVRPMAQRRNRQQDPQLMGDSTRVLVSY